MLDLVAQTCYFYWIENWINFFFFHQFKHILLCLLASIVSDKMLEVIFKFPFIWLLLDFTCIISFIFSC